MEQKGTYRMQQLREALGLSREEVGQILGYSRWTIWRWETGRAEVDQLALIQLQRIARKAQ